MRPAFRGVARGAATAAVLSVLVLATLPLAHAQQPGKVFRVGVIAERSPTDPFHVAFQQGIVLEYRYAHGALDRVSDLAAELVRIGVDLIISDPVFGSELAQLSRLAIDRRLPAALTG